METKTTVVLTEKNFEQQVLRSTGLVVVDFWADWCGPCHIIAPVIEELAVAYEGRVKVGKLDTEASPKIAERYGIRSIPTLLFFKDGEVVDQAIGALPKSVLVEKLDQLL